MKRLVMFALVAAVAVAFTGCKKKEPTLSERMNSMTKQVDKAAKGMAKDADKAAADAKAKADEALKK